MHAVLKSILINQFFFHRQRAESDEEELSELQWNPPTVVPICLVSHLKTISIRRFKGWRVDMEVAKYLLQNGRVLNKMTIYPGFLYMSENEMYKELLMFHRAMTCQVEIMDMQV